MYSKYMIYSLYLICNIFLTSQLSIKKTFPKLTSTFKNQYFYSKVLTTTTTTKTNNKEIKKDEPFSKCFSYIEKSSNNLRNYSNQINCNTDCSVMKKVIIFPLF